MYSQTNFIIANCQDNITHLKISFSCTLRKTETTNFYCGVNYKVHFKYEMKHSIYHRVTEWTSY